MTTHMEVFSCLSLASKGGAGATRPTHWRMGGNVPSWGEVQVGGQEPHVGSRPPSTQRRRPGKATVTESVTVRMHTAGSGQRRRQFRVSAADQRSHSSEHPGRAATPAASSRPPLQQRPSTHRLTCSESPSRSLPGGMSDDCSVRLNARYDAYTTLTKVMEKREVWEMTACRGG